MKPYEERLPLIDAAIESMKGKWPDTTLDYLVEAISPANWTCSFKPDEYICTRKEFNQRKAELQNKPSWSDAPEWANWLCQDHKGKWMWFSVKPNTEGNVWCVTRIFNCGLEVDFRDGLAMQTIEQGVVIGDWRDTLEKRPKTKVSAFNAEDYVVDVDNGEASPVSELPTESDDPVNHPPHYTQHPSGVECIQITEHCNFCIGNAIKYLWRAGLKGAAVEDLKKARWYIEREIERLEGEK